MISRRSFLGFLGALPLVPYIKPTIRSRTFTHDILEVDPAVVSPTGCIIRAGDWAIRTPGKRGTVSLMSQQLETCLKGYCGITGTVYLRGPNFKQMLVFTPPKHIFNRIRAKLAKGTLALNDQIVWVSCMTGMSAHFLPDRIVHQETCFVGKNFYNADLRGHD